MEPVLVAQRQSGYDRNDDEAYFTPAWVTRLVLESLGEDASFDTVYDGAAGAGHILQAVEDLYPAIHTIGTDLNAWRPQVCSADIWLMSFLSVLSIPDEWGRTLLMFNPPFGASGRLAEKFIKHACKLIQGTQHEALFLLAHNFDAAAGRTAIFADCQQYHSKLVVLPRIQWANIEPDPEHGSSSDHAWYRWTGEPAPSEPVTRWIGNRDLDRSFDVWTGTKQN